MQQETGENKRETKTDSERGRKHGCVCAVREGDRWQKRLSLNLHTSCVFLYVFQVKPNRQSASNTQRQEQVYLEANSALDGD